MTEDKKRVGVLGATGWGTTLAILMASQGHRVTLWARTAEEAGILNKDRENKRLLPGFPFPEALTVTCSTDEAFQTADMVIIAVPSKRFRANLQRVQNSLNQSGVIISATKGLELGTGFRMSQIMEQELPEPLLSHIGVLSGPNLSKEIAKRIPSSTVVASKDAELASTAQAMIMTPYFRVYTNTDVLGVELGGALKNTIAIGAGISDGLGFGDNAKAAFITRGLAEITRLGVAAGASPLTFTGLAGLGDLIATSASPLSRNRHVGEHLAKGRKLTDILATMQNVAEGVDTTAVAMNIAHDLNVEMPITEATYRILFEGLDPKQAVTELLGRAPQPE